MKSRPTVRALTLAVLLTLVVRSASADVPVGPEPPPRDQLETTQRLLASAAASLSSLPPEESATYGGHIEAAIAGLDQAVADAGAAIEVRSRPMGGFSPPAFERAIVPHLPQVAFNAPRTPLVEAVMELNDALATLVHNLPNTDGRISADQFHAKLLADLGRAGAELSAGVDYHNHQPVAAAPLAESAPPESMLPTIVASIALSLGMALAGLYWFSRRKNGGPPIKTNQT